MQPAAAAGAPELASLEQVCGRSDLQVGCHNERGCSQQVARLREWGLLGLSGAPHTHWPSEGIRSSSSLELGSTGKWLKSRGPLRYASSCSGVDFIAQALQRVYGVGGWQYVAACEKDARSRRILAQQVCVGGWPEGGGHLQRG